MKKIAQFLPLSAILALNFMIVGFAFIPTESAAVASCGAFDWTTAYYGNHPACEMDETLCTGPIADHSTCTYVYFEGKPEIVIEAPPISGIN